MNTLQEVKDYIEDMGYEEIMVFDSPDYATAFIGISDDNRAIYDYNKMVQFLVEKEGMDEDEAVDFISFNSSFSQEYYPIIMYPINE